MKSISFSDAFALGVYHSCVSLVTGYPGYPVNQVFNAVKAIKEYKKREFTIEWCVNEVVACENAMGASFAGARSLVIMKNHGANTIIDVLINISYIGVVGGFVLLIGDDTKVQASQNQSDSREFGRLVKIPVFEPATVNNAYSFIIQGYKLSENINTPVIIRITGELVNLHGDLELQNNKAVKRKRNFSFSPDKKIFFIGPTNYKWMKRSIFQRIYKLQRKRHMLLNTLIKKSKDEGIILSGKFLIEASKQYNKKTMLIVGMPYPLSHADLDLFFQYLEDSAEVTIIEETEPLLASQVRMYLYKNNKYDIKIIDSKDYSEISDKEKKLVPLSQFDNTVDQIKLCPACPGRALLLSFKLLNLKVIGDAGCTALGCLAPFHSVHSSICMGSSIALAAGINKVSKEQVIALIGDSSFFHNGILGLINEMNHETDLFIVIFNNYNAALTGGQEVLSFQKDQYSTFIKNILLSSGVEKTNIRVIDNNLNLKKIKRDVYDLFTHYSGLRFLIVNGICHYQIQDFFQNRIKVGGKHKNITGLKIDPGCFACKHNGKDHYKIYVDFCKACSICKELIEIQCNEGE
jgi:indolepyruvate ferredoxin oxidoreductase, alpha subunit